MLPFALEGKDVFVQSQTGTGKTAAFLVSLFQLMDKSGERAIIITPTRELATQIEAEAKVLSLFLDLNIITVIGGISYQKNERELAQKVDILIGTPGRIIDLANKRTLNLQYYSYAVIDEADRMFDMGFVDDIKKILGRLPDKRYRQTMLFSATLNFRVKLLASRQMNNPEEILIESKNITVDQISQMLYHVSGAHKMELLLGLLRKHDFKSALIFLNTKYMCEEVAGRLCDNGFDADFLTGDLMQNQRENRIMRFKNGELAILVATDVAARGIHIDDLELVVNYDVPMDAENYVHRIGRTARAGKSGTAITMACESYVEYLEPIEKFIKAEIPSTVADESFYGEDKSDGKSYKRRMRTTRPGDRDKRGGPRSSGPRRGGSGSGGYKGGSRSSSSIKQGSSYKKPASRSTQAPAEQPAERPKSSRNKKPINSPRKPQSQGAVKKSPTKTRKRGIFSRIASIFK